MNREAKPDTTATERSGRGRTSEPRSSRTSPAEFLREVRSELRKVAWPSWREVVNYSVVVLVVTLFLTLFVWALDWTIRNATVNLFG